MNLTSNMGSRALASPSATPIHTYPKPWCVDFNGTVASIHSADGDCVPWKMVESAMNAPQQRKQPVGEVAELVKELRGPYSTLARSLAHRAASARESLAAQVAELKKEK